MLPDHGPHSRMLEDESIEQEKLLDKVGLERVELHRVHLLQLLLTVHLCVRVHVCVYVCACVHAQNKHARTHTHARTHKHIHIRMYRSRQRKTVVLTKAPFQLAELCVFELFRHLRLWLLLHLKLHVAQHPEEGWLAAAAAARASAARLAPNHLLGHGENGAQTVRCAASACACVCQ